MLRSIFVTALMLVGLRYTLKGVFYILLFYLWLAYFRPEQWLWVDFVTPLNLSFVVGAVVLVGGFMSRDRGRLGFAPLLFGLFLTHSLVSTILSPTPLSVWPYWIEFAKTAVIGFMMVLLVNDEQKLRLTLMVIAGSVAFEGAKQGFAQFALSPGTPNANGSPVFGDNNGVAVGVLMLVPVLTALAGTAKRKLERFPEAILALGLLLRGLGTYSRGGFLAAGALGLHYLMRSKRRVAAIIVVVIVGGVISQVLPRQFWSRMSTIQSDAEDPDAADSSAAGRLYFWQVAIDMADRHPVFGVGLNGFQFNYDDYDTSNGYYGRGRAVHSAWFGALADLGYVGLFLFSLIVGRALLVAARARRLASAHPELSALARYATAIEASLVVFAVGGAFVSLQYNELLWHLFALSMALDGIVAARAAELTAASPAMDLPAVERWQALAGARLRSASPLSRT